MDERKKSSLEKENDHEVKNRMDKKKKKKDGQKKSKKIPGL